MTRMNYEAPAKSEFFTYSGMLLTNQSLRIWAFRAANIDD